MADQEELLEKKKKKKKKKKGGSITPTPTPTPRVVVLLSSLLQRAVERTEAASGTTHAAASAFHGATQPGISVRAYLERIFKYAGCSPSCYVLALIYLHRFSLPIDSLNVHRLLITSVLLAVKFLDDIYYSNGYFAKVGGISLKEMNYLEINLLFGLGFELNVTSMEFNSYCSLLQNEAMRDHLECSPDHPRCLFHCFPLPSSNSEEEEQEDPNCL